jgi:7,8-dihydropterin-6-yl-methyl-4-(beta-D-ribofuranosyl)aminobenzene 5'-phosphate synthase
MKKQSARGAVTITVLIDNAHGDPELRSQWGLSFWVETPAARVLLDTGASDAFLRNARRLGVPLETADACVLSHGHFDHGGGIAKVVDAAPRAPFVLHPGALMPRYWLCRTGKRDPIGLPERSLVALRGQAERTVWAVGPTEVAPGVWATGPVPRRHPLEEAERNFFFDDACTVRDHVVDDQALWIETAEGLIILCGCAHSGAINTVEHVRAVAGRARDGEGAGEGRSVAPAPDGLPRVRAVLGGFHLLQARKDRLLATADCLDALGLELCAPCHCTGKRATSLLRERLGAAFVDVASGSRLTFE